MGKYFLALKEKGVRARVFLTPANSNLPRRPVSAALTVNKTKIFETNFFEIKTFFKPSWLLANITKR